jgi:hypothetical protein
MSGDGGAQRDGQIEITSMVTLTGSHVRNSKSEADLISKRGIE